MQTSQLKSHKHMAAAYAVLVFAMALGISPAAATWSAPGAVTLEAGSLGVQLGGEKIDIVILSRGKQRRSKLLSDRFTIGSDASAAWGNSKSAHEDPKATVLFFGDTKGVFAGFGLDGATLKPDDSANKALYGNDIYRIGGVVESYAVK